MFYCENAAVDFRRLNDLIFYLFAVGCFGRGGRVGAENDIEGVRKVKRLIGVGAYVSIVGAEQFCLLLGGMVK